MTIGVAIMSYYYGPFVANAIDSVLAQTIKPDQIIVVDDASKDMTAEVAALYGVPHIVREKNMGLGPNFEDVLQNVMTTDLMMFLGGDNWIHPVYIEKTLEKINEKVKVVATDCYIVGEYQRAVAEQVKAWYNDKYDLPVWSYPRDDISERNWIHGSALFDRKAAIDSGGFMKDNLRGADYDLWKNMHWEGWEFDKVEQPLLYYRKHRFNYNRGEIDRAKEKGDI